MINILIADDHHLVRNGLVALLESLPEMEVIGEASDGAEAVRMAADLRPDVVVMDVAMPRLDGSQAAEKILGVKNPPSIVMLSMHADPILIRRMLESGVRGYLLKKSAPEELALAVRAAARRETYLSPLVADSVMHGMLDHPARGAPTSAAELLTPREREVLQLIAEGSTNNGIAETLHISVKTVEKHRANLMAKLEVQGLAELMRAAFARGLIFSDLHDPVN